MNDSVKERILCSDLNLCKDITKKTVKQKNADILEYISKIK